MNAPVIFYDSEKASAAYARYQALRLSERADPSLADEECFQILLSDAYRAFENAFCAPTFEVMQ